MYKRAISISDEAEPVPFRPAWWCRGANQQTILGALFRPGSPCKLRRQRWETPDGDFVDLDLLPGAPGTPVLIVLHGLGGSSRSRGSSPTTPSTTERTG